MYANISQCFDICANMTLRNGCCSSVDNDSSLSEEPWLPVLKYMDYVTVPVFLVLGILGSSLTIIMMLSKTFKQFRSRYMFVAICVSEICFQLTQPLNHLSVQDALGIDLRATSRTACKLFFVVYKTSKLTWCWLLMTLWLERVIAVWMPLHVKHIVNKRTIFRAIIFIDCVILAFNSVWSFSSDIEMGTCQPDAVLENAGMAYRDFHIAGAIIYSLPLFVIIIFIPLIMVKIFHRRRTIGRMTINEHYRNRKRRETRSSASLTCTILTYIVLVTPMTFSCMIKLSRKERMFTDDGAGWSAILRRVSMMLEQLNFAVNFVLYVMISGEFRKYLRMFWAKG